MPDAQPPLLYKKSPAERRAVMTFNRPERMNAMSPELQALQRDAIADFNADPDLWVLIVTGAGNRAFSAGADLGSTIPNMSKRTRDQPLQVSDTRVLHDVHKPVLAAINGYCIAGGLEFMLGTDIRVAAEHAEFGLQEVRWGIVPISGSHIRLPRQIPWCWAMELLLTGRRLKAHEALACGLINRVVPLDELMPTTHGIADLICANGPLAVRTAKEIAVRGAMGMSWEQAWSLESLLGARAFGSEDAIEGPKAFMEKRPPQFKGR